VTELTEKIRSKGFWDVVIRAEDFDPDRVPYDKLLSVLEGAAVRFRGWPVPMVDRRREVLRGQNWIGQDIPATVVQHYEAWRLFTSGQFNHLRGIDADWRPHREAPVPEGFSSVIEVWEILFYVTEVFELAARLTLARAAGNSVVIEVTLRGLRGRALVVGEHNRAEFVRPCFTSAAQLSRTVTLDRDRLIGQAHREAAEMAHWFFVRFGWSPPMDQLADHQRELTERP
jgi:hypothetical protein